MKGKWERKLQKCGQIEPSIGFQTVSNKSDAVSVSVYVCVLVWSCARVWQWQIFQPRNNSQWKNSTRCLFPVPCVYWTPETKKKHKFEKFASPSKVKSDPKGIFKVWECFGQIVPHWFPESDHYQCMPKVVLRSVCMCKCGRVCFRMYRSNHVWSFIWLDSILKSKV